MLTYKLFFQYEKPAEDQAPDREVQIEPDEVEFWDHESIANEHCFEDMEDDDAKAVWVQSPSGKWKAFMLSTTTTTDYNIDPLTQGDLDSYRAYMASLPSGTTK